MSVFKNLLPIKSNIIVSAGLCFIIIASAILVSPAITPFQNVRAAIDETMPAIIPDSIIADWKDQDQVYGSDYSSAIDSIVGKLPAEYAEKYNAEKAGLSEEKLYLWACHFRRVSRMKKHEVDLENIMFTRHHNFGGVHIGYHDNADTGNSDMDWAGKGALCVLTMKNYYSTFKEILTRTDAVIRDPCISFDGKKVLFAMSGKGKGTGYKIFEMTISDTTTLMQLTTDPGKDLPIVADFEPCFLPNGDILFTSTRNFGLAAQSTNPTTNMFLMNGEGKYMRQVGFDQAHTFYPVLMEDGTVLYTRWEYNDRDATKSMGLFTMNPDGSHQTECFGNQNGWPYTFLHGRPIPGTHGAKAICVAGGFHGPYCGELLIIDRSKGTNGAQSISMIAPKRETKPHVTKSDISMGNADFRWAYPLPLDESDLLVSWRKTERANGGSGGMGLNFDGIFKLYFMDIDGNRELLAWADQSVSQPVLIKARTIPPKVFVQADYNDSLGTFTMQDVYVGGGMKGIPRGIAKTLRVVAMHCRVSGGSIGSTMGSGPSGAFKPVIFCPVSAYGASWEAKEVLGEAKIYEDGSASFKAPARTPVFFQVLDSMGYCIATMRSWSTLMPGETFSCWGCHENKVADYGMFGNAQAGVPRKLETPLGIENKPFDYKQMVQPIFDNKCVKCHTTNHTSGFDLRPSLVTRANKSWTVSYDSLLKGIPVATSNNAVNICTIFSPPEQQPPYSFGSSKSGIMIKGGMSGSHHDVQVTETEKRIAACWIDLCAPYAGKYNSDMSASDSIAYAKLLDNRVKWAAIEKENIKALLATIPVMPNDHGRVKYTRAITDQLRIGYISPKRALVLENISQGNLMVLDLRGRVIYHINLSNRQTSGAMTILLPAPLSLGLYLVRLEGVNGIRRTKISIME